MARRIDFAFSLLSPWTYLGFDAFLAIAEKYDLAITYRPVLLGEVFSQTGGLPLAQRHPARQNYRWLELRRWRAARNLPLNLAPKGFPCDITLADCTAIALIQSGEDPAAFCRAVMRGIWAEERQLDDPVEITKILVDAGHDHAFVERARLPEITAIYVENRDWAIAKGVFGAPSFVLDGEIFWGQDRLDLLEAALASGRAPYRAEAGK